MRPICKIDEYGAKRWFLNNLLHREDGPAIEWFDGSKFWYINGKYHREDGPAIEWHNGYKAWYYHGKPVICKDNKEFLRMIKLKVFL